MALREFFQLFALLFRFIVIGGLMKKQILAIIALAMVSVIVVGCGQEAVAPASQQTQQKGKTPDGKEAGGKAEVPVN